MTWIAFAVLAYVGVQLGVAAWAARRTKTDEDYLIAGRRLGLFAVAMSLFATWFGSEAVIASSAAVADEGLAGARIDPFAYGLGILVLGLLVASTLRAGGFVTIADYMRTRFGPVAEQLTATAVAISALLWAAAQLAALAAIVSSVSGVGFITALSASLALVIAYTLLGGMIGDVVTDMIQGVVIVIGLAVLFGLMIHQAGGWSTALSAIDPLRLSFGSSGEESWLDRLDIWLVPILGSIVSQEALARTLGARSPKTARNGAILASLIYMTVGLLPIGFGLIAPSLGLLLDEGDGFLPSLAAAIAPGWLFVMFSGALLSAILSTVDSALLAASGVLTENVHKRLRPDASPAERLTTARIATVLVAVLAFAFAASGEGVRALVFTASSIGGAILVPFLIGLWRGKASDAAASAAIAVHFACLAVLEWTLEIPGAYLIAIAGALGVFMAVSSIQKPAPGLR